VSTGSWLVDVFGKWAPLATLVGCAAILVLHWVFIRPRMTAWVDQEPAKREHRATLMVTLHAVPALLLYLYFFL